MSLLGEPLGAKQAVDIGLIYKCVPDADLMKETLKIAEQLAKGPTIAFYETRRMFDEGDRKSFTDQVDDEMRIQGELGDMPDFMIGVKKFRGQSKEPFTGRRGPAKL